MLTFIFLQHDKVIHIFPFKTFNYTKFEVLKKTRKKKKIAPCFPIKTVHFYEEYNEHIFILK